MKLIVNADTGEVEEVEETNDLVEKKLYEIGAVDEEMVVFLEEYAHIEKQYNNVKAKLEEAMEQYNIKKWETDKFTVTRKEESLQKRLDTDRLKEDGIYDKYLKLVPVKSSISIRFKKEK